MATLSDVLSSQLGHLDESRQQSIIALNVVMVILATVAVVLRLLARKLVSVPWKADDYAIIIALVSSYGLFITTMFSVRNGLGKHVLANTPQGVVAYTETLYAFLLIYPVCLPTVKISIVLFYKRIFATPRFSVALNVLGTVIVLWSISAWLVALLQCRPVSAFWDKSIDGYCINSYLFISIEGGITVLTDIVLLVMPMPLVWKLKISRRQKIALSGVFLIGGFVCITSIIRLPYLHDIFTLDSTWTTYAPSQWSTVEAYLSIVCACLPIMRPLVRRSILASMSRSRVSQPSGIVFSDVQASSSRNKEWWPEATMREMENDEGATSSSQHLNASLPPPWRPPTQSGGESEDGLTAVKTGPRVGWKETPEMSRKMKDVELGLTPAREAEVAEERADVILPVHHP